MAESKTSPRKDNKRRNPNSPFTKVFALISTSKFNQFRRVSSNDGGMDKVLVSLIDDYLNKSRANKSKAEKKTSFKVKSDLGDRFNKEFGATATMRLSALMEKELSENIN